LAKVVWKPQLLRRGISPLYSLSLSLSSPLFSLCVIIFCVSISVKRLSEFLYSYVDTYQRLVGELSQPMQQLVRALPPCLLSGKIVAYMLTDAIVICDEVTTPLLPSLPFRTFEKRTAKISESEIEVRKIDASSGQFTHFLTLGTFKFTGEQKSVVFGRHGGISFLTIKAGAQERYLGETLIFGYLDESGWDERWAWLVAKETLQENVGSAIFRLMFSSGLASEQEIRELGQQEAARIGLERFRRSVSQFENFLKLYPDEEQRFQGLFETYPYLLSMWGKVIPKPFLHCGKTVSNIEAGRVPDFLIRELDGSCTLVEIESPSKHVFTEGNDPRPTQYLTQAENQVRQWDQIIRRNPTITTSYPGIEYYRARVIIGRSYHPAFPSYAAFQSELASVNEQRSRIRFETYDVLLEEARAALGFLEMIFSGVPLPSVK
jgi:hypothetical protein